MVVGVVVVVVVVGVVVVMGVVVVEVMIVGWGGVDDDNRLQKIAADIVAPDPLIYIGVYVCI